MLKLAQRDYPTAPVVTCNSGIKLVHPDWYFMQDKAAIRMFCTPALEKQKAGMKIFALRQTVHQLALRGITVDSVIEEVIQTGPGQFRPGYTTCNFSGIFCAEFALQHGAKTIVAVGHEGYHKTAGELLNWDGTKPSPVWLGEYTDTWLAPWWRGAVCGRPDVTFHFYGGLNFPIEGPNVRRSHAA
jgi:hypothetical protein